MARADILMLMTNQEKQSASRLLLYFEMNYWWTEGIVWTLLGRN